MVKKTSEVSIEQLPGMMVDQVPARFAVWTREEGGEGGDWALVREDFRTVEDLGRFIHELQLQNDHSVVIREHGHKVGMKPLLELLQEKGVLHCDCDLSKRRQK
jgi:hypothetical protein